MGHFIFLSNSVCPIPINAQLSSWHDSGVGDASHLLIGTSYQMGSLCGLDNVVFCNRLCQEKSMYNINMTAILLIFFNEKPNLATVHAYQSIISIACNYTL
jgi:hypothetical protein